MVKTEFEWLNGRAIRCKVCQQANLRETMFAGEVQQYDGGGCKEEHEDDESDANGNAKFEWLNEVPIRCKVSGGKLVENGSA